jgi:[ribosomal protein S5]-alanine N-acetyltransferase
VKLRAFRTRRLVVRPFAARDYASWAEAYRGLRPRQGPQDWVPPKGLPIDRREFAKLLRRYRGWAAREETFVWAIFHRKTGAHLGRIDVSPAIRHYVRSANLGYRILNPHWRRGYAKEALRALIPGALRDLRLNRLEAVIDRDNRPSLALCRSVGMRREGVREAYFYQDGGWADQVVYVADRRDFGVPMLRL